MEPTQENDSCQELADSIQRPGQILPLSTFVNRVDSNTATPISGCVFYASFCYHSRVEKPGLHTS